MPYLERGFPPTPRDAHDTIVRRLSEFGEARLAVASTNARTLRRLPM